jgi:hypothetical protein
MSLTPQPRDGDTRLTFKHLVVLFLMVTGLYLGAFHGLEYWNHRLGPWEVEFTSDAAAQPALIVRQRALQLAAVRIEFPGERVAQSNFAARVQFDSPAKPIPYGRVIYDDLRQLPGVVTFDLFGHEIELLPRVLIANKQEVAWQSGRVLALRSTQKLPEPPRPPAHPKRRL